MKINKKKNKYAISAQGMVEFALALPILLLLVFGLLEVGRLAFVYATIVTASREAVRYGSATGENDAASSLRYADCTGIRAAAQKVDFLGVIDDSNIIINYDTGPGTPNNIYGCQGGLTPPPAPVAIGDRITVEVTGEFVPIVVNIVPLTTHSLQSINSHSLLGSVPIPRPWIGSDAEDPGVDVCPNILGTQTTIPSGMHLDVNGDCVANTGIDVCLNIAGIQTEPPIGWISDVNLNCVVNPAYEEIEDLCLNIVGIQNPNPPINNPIPTGLIRNEEGNCVLPPPACVVTTLPPEVDSFYTLFTWKVTNSIATTLDKVTVTWPEGSGDLGQIEIDGSNLLTESIPGPTNEVDGNDFALAPGEHTLVFTFTNNPLSGLFQISSSFSSPCPPVGGSITLYPVTHSGTFPPSTNQSYSAGPWTLNNHTGTPLTISNINIKWGNKSNCTSEPNLNSFTLGSITWTKGAQPNNTWCNGLNILPPVGTTWYLNAGISDMLLTYAKKGVSDIIVNIYVQGTGGFTSYIIDSSNPLQNP